MVILKIFWNEQKNAPTQIDDSTVLLCPLL